ncbi:MAG: LysM peptidoglycan-binding domain-containing protein [Paracoccaceae bacterium]
MKKGLAGGLVGLALVAVAFLGWNQFAGAPDTAGDAVIGDQTVLTPAPQSADVEAVTSATSGTQTPPIETAASPTAEPAGSGVTQTPEQVDTADLAREATVVVPDSSTGSENASAPDRPFAENDPESLENAISQELSDEGQMLPLFDLVRVDADGQTVVAGKANPGDRVEILLDGEVIGEADADGSGAFVGIVTAPLSGAAQQLQLRTVRKEVEPIAVAAAVSDPAQATPAEVEPAEIQPPAPQAEGGAETATRDPIESATAADDSSKLLAVEPVTTQTEQQDPLPSTVAPAGQSAPELAATTTASGQADEMQVVRAEPTQPDARPEKEIVGEQAPAYAVSTPVIILPSSSPEDAPALIQPQEDRVALLQPQGRSSSVTLDAIRYGETGAVQLNGRGAPGNSVRIYGNGDRLGDTGIEDNGTWGWALARERALGVRLFRFDELTTKGAVSSRIETPFTYEATSPKIVRQREVVIQRGDYLWTIAEQFYGTGVRYSLIYGANSDLIRDPDLIYPGQVFSVPELVDAE